MKTIRVLSTMLICGATMLIATYQPLVVNASTIYEDMYSRSLQISEKELVGLTVTKIEIKNRWNITLTDDETDLLAKIVWLESRGESNKGQQAVVEVIFNRMRHIAFEGSLYEVLSQKDQFCTWKTRNSAEPTNREYKNIEKVLNNETDLTTPNTVYFSTKARNNKVSAHIGNHYFCEYEK